MSLFKTPEYTLIGKGALKGTKSYSCSSCCSDSDNQGVMEIG